MFTFQHSCFQTLASQHAGRIRVLSVVLLACFSAALLFAGSVAPVAVPGSVSPGMAPLVDTLVEASVCAGGSYQFGDKTLTEAGTYEQTFTASDGSDSTVTLVLTVFPAPVTEISVTLCAGTPYEFGGNTLTEAGDYADTLQTDAGCDSILLLHLDYVPFFKTALVINACAGDTVFFGTDTLTVTGMYVDTLTASGGCDSIVGLILTVYPRPVTQLKAGICEGSTFIFGADTLSISGTYTDTLKTVNGCDSLVVLDLAVVSFFETPVEATICSGEHYLFGDQDLTENGVYTDTLTAAGGCDSILILTLTVLPPTPLTEVEATICSNASYTLGNEILTEDGVYMATLAGSNGCDSMVVLTLTVLPVSKTDLSATICSNESYSVGSEVFTEAGDYTVVLTAENGCDSIVQLNLSVLPASETISAVTICAGTTLEFNGLELTEPGLYSIVLSNFIGCDSTVNLNLSVAPVDQTDLFVTICAGEGYEFDGNSLTESGEYIATYTNIFGCDSTVNLTLTVLDPVPGTTLAATLCAGEMYALNGMVFSQSGTYVFHYTAENGCDSTVILTLEVLPAALTAVEATICGNTTYAFYGAMLQESGQYEQVFTAENGCDSTIALTLTVLPVYETNLTVQICSAASFEFNGETLTESGAYSAMLTAENGCDSLVNLELAVLDTIFTSVSAEICAGQAYAFDGQDLDASGEYTGVFASEAGCDSIVTLALTVLPVSTRELEASICVGAVYEFNGDEISESGTYFAILTNEAGCDSTVTLTLTVLPAQATEIEAGICAGASYMFNGDEITESGTYFAILTSEAGCDSTVTLTLTVSPVFATEIEASICAGSAYTFNGEELTEGGTYIAALTSEAGCDSTVTLTLTVLPTSATEIEARICAGSVYEFNGDELTESGTYFAILTNEAGCDSTVTLTLQVLQVIQTEFTAITCSGESYTFNGQVLTESGDYTATFSASSGCDSIVTLHLDFYPVSHTNLAASICAGESYPFGGQNLTTAGIYSISLQNSFGCDSTVTLVLTVFQVDATILQQGSTLTVNAVNATYQWIDCSSNQPIAGATGNSYTPAVTGQYAVQVTQNGCTKTSACILVEIVSTNAPGLTLRWTLAPNPALDYTLVRLEASTDAALTVDVYDLTGRLCMQQRVPVQANSVRLNMNAMPEGLYFVRLTDGQHVSAPKRLVKARD